MYKTADGRYEHDFRQQHMPRMVVSYGRVKKADADKLHAVAVALFRARDRETALALQAGRVTIQQLAQLHALGRPFASVLATVAPEHPWPTFTDARAQYIDGLRKNPNRTQKTASVAGEQLVRAEKFFGPDTRLDAITSEMVVAYQDHLIGDGLAVNTVTQYVMRVGALFRWHLRREAIAARDSKRAARTLYVPIDVERISTKQTARDRWLTQDEAAALFAVTPPQLLFPIAAGLLAGLRISETLHLRPAFDVDLETGVLIIQRQPEWSPKTKRSIRHVPISDALRPLLTQHLARYASEAWVVPAFSDDRRPMSRDVLDHHVRTIVGAAGLVVGRKDPKGVTYHTFRHTFASWLLMAGADIFTVAQLLGDSVKQVEDTYGHLSKDHRQAAVNRLSALVVLR